MADEDLSAELVLHEDGILSAAEGVPSPLTTSNSDVPCIGRVQSQLILRMLSGCGIVPQFCGKHQANRRRCLDNRD